MQIRDFDRIVENVKRLTFLRDVHLRLGYLHVELFSVLSRDNILKYQPNFSPQGDKIAFVKTDSTTRSHNIWIMDADGGSPRQLTREKGLSTLPSFAPDGRALTFTSNFKDKNYDIYLLDIASLRITRLTQHPGLDTYSRFSPDGTKLIFVSNRGGNQQIWVMNKDGSGAKQITSGDAESVSPAWGEIKE
jgi:TolB protein